MAAEAGAQTELCKRTVLGYGAGGAGSSAARTHCRGRCCGLLHHHSSCLFHLFVDVCFLVCAVWRREACVCVCAHVLGIQRTPQNAPTIFVLFCFVAKGSLTSLKLTKQARLTGQQAQTCAFSIPTSTPGHSNFQAGISMQDQVFRPARHTLS